MKNVNLLDRNYPGIDGADEVNKVMVQITSTYSNEKIEHTIEKIMEMRLYERFNRMIFMFLQAPESPRKALRPQFLAKINEKIGGSFVFDPYRDLMDLTDIYRFHANTQDLEKLLRAVKVLDESFDFGGGGISGYDALSVSFHDEELEHVFLLVDAIIKEGINVYTSSEKLYNKFVKATHPLKEFIIYSAQFGALDHINFTIVVLSKAFINQLLRAKLSCKLFNHAVANDAKIEFVSFDQGLRDYGKVAQPKIRGYRQMTELNVARTVQNILRERLKTLALANIGANEVRQELISLHREFEAKDIIKESKYILLNFRMTRLRDIEMNYLILGPKAIPHTIAEKIKEIPTPLKNLIVLVPKDFYQKTRRRLTTIGGMFQSENVHYLDEYLYDHVIEGIPRQSILNTDDFVQPVIECSDENIGINSIIHWIFSNSDSAVAIITGEGGIGKTTVCEKLHDTIIKDNAKVIIIFIDASKYIEVFRRYGQDATTEYDLYNIFKECYPYSNQIDRNSFYLNYSLGNLILIFDGIDEILSTIPTFSLDTFLRNLEEVRARIGMGKILINCRDTYINDLSGKFAREGDPEDEQGKPRLQIYRLLGFNDQLAETFFQKVVGDAKRVVDCMRMIREIYSDANGEYRYPPFVLKVVSQIVSAGFAYHEINMDFNSQVLQQDDKDDVVAYRICAREFAKRVENGFQLEIDDQIRFLCEVAIEEKGRLSKRDFPRILENIGKKDRLDEVVPGLTDHPLLQKSNGDFIFRFDFFNIYFKSVAIFNMLCSEFKPRLTERLINIIAFDCNYNSVLSRFLTKKAHHSKIHFNQCLKYSKQFVGEISSFPMVDLEEQTRKKRAISNLVIIILMSKPPNASHELILDYIFGDGKGQISGFSFIDVPSDSGITFNFSNRLFTNATIQNYGGFFNCIFDSGTFFDDTCYINNVYSDRVDVKKISARESNFDKRIHGDNSIFKMMTIRDNPNGLIRFYSNYFRPFYKNRQFQREVAITAISIPADDRITIGVLNRILLKNDILTKAENGKVFADPKLKNEIFHFLDEGSTFRHLNRAIDDLREWLLSGQMPDKDD